MDTGQVTLSSSADTSYLGSLRSCSQVHEASRRLKQWYYGLLCQYVLWPASLSPTQASCITDAHCCQTLGARPKWRLGLSTTVQHTACCSSLLAPRVCQPGCCARARSLLIRDGGPLPSRKPFHLSPWGQHAPYFKQSATDTVRPKTATASPTTFHPTNDRCTSKKTDQARNNVVEV